MKGPTWIIRRVVKAPLNLCGLDLVRYHPKYEKGPYAYLDSLNIRSVIDIGAHAGEFAIMIGELLPAAEIICFEPLQLEFQQLQEKLGGKPNLRAFNYALGDRNESAEMWRNEWSQSSSLLPMAKLHKEAFPETERETVETVEVRRLDDVLDPAAIQPEVLIKIDVQGFEDKVLAGAARTLAHTKALIIEVSFRELYHGQPLFDDIYERLRHQGFAYRGNLYQLVDPRDGSVLQADALFVAGA